MVAQAAIPIVTAVGEYAAPYLIREAGKIGIKKFIETYGSTAFQTIAGSVVGGMILDKAPPLDLQQEKLFGMPVSRITGQEEVYSDIEEPKKVEPLGYIDTVHGGKGPLEPIKAKPFPAETEVKKWDESFKAPEKIETTEGLEAPPQEKIVPPGFETPKTVDTSILTKDISKQTKDLVKEEPEFGALTEVEKQTALLEKGDKPDFYSRAIAAITNAKQDKYTKGKWKSIVKGNTTKEEMDYLGLTELLEGKESITKQELLKLVKDKDIAATMTVRPVPKDQMNPMYQEYTLGGNTFETQEHIVFQKSTVLEDELKQYDEEKKERAYIEPHFSYSDARNTFAHARVQVGYDQTGTENMYSHNEEAYQEAKIFFDNLEKTFRNTLIIDEIQSQWIQEGQDKGFVSDWNIVESDNLIEFLNKNNIEYEIRENFMTEGNTAIKIYKKSPTDPTYNERRDFHVVDFNPKTSPGARYLFNPKGQFKKILRKEDSAIDKILEWGSVPDLPIKDSKKFVELVLNEMIRKAVKDGRDSVAITNGQIQYNRYPEMKEEDKQGLKKFYDTFVYDQLNKIAKNYGVELERIDIGDTEQAEIDQTETQIQFPRKVKTAQTAGHTLQQLTGEHLAELVNDTRLPPHASIYTNEGRGQGLDYILNVLNNQEQLQDKYYIWTKTKIPEYINEAVTIEDFQEINWDIPIVKISDTLTNPVVKKLLDISQEERASILKSFTIGGAGSYPYEGDKINNIDLIKYTEYLRNYKPPEGVDLGYEQDVEQLIKMKLPKKLQNDILKKSIRLTKVEQQTDRMFG